ncbi:MAG: hypothetical protein EHM55_07860 [Acidobacteria bacterium]|nr:MAG: hypothetical protein EHM55_07860 [Acidobacteriota bacterium]
MPTYPTHLRSGTGTAPFERRPNLYSRRHSGRADTSGAVDVISDEAKTVFAIYEGQPRARNDADDIGPVYSAGTGGPLAVPTGRVFVRLEEHARAVDKRPQFEAAGFEIEGTPSYAPHTAWLVPRQGGVAYALPALADLERIPDVVHVEPQLLMGRALKTR